MSYEWLDVETGKKGLMVIDLGYVTEKNARDRADKLFAAGIGKSNLCWGPSTGDARIHIKIPPKKQAMVLGKFPIKKEKTWFGATHSYLSD